jgi:AsmA family protein
MRWIRFLGWIVGILVAVIVAAGAAVWFGGAPVIAWAIEHPGSALMGRQLRIAGAFVIHWGAPTRIIAEDVHVANAPWGTAPEMFSAKRLEIDVFLRSLLGGPVRVPLVAIDGAKLLLETSAEGEGNWKFGASAAAPKKRHEFPDLRRFVVRDSEIVWHNGRTGAHTDLGVATLDYGAPNQSSPVSFKTVGTYVGSFQTLPLRLSGTLGSLAELRNPTRPYPVHLEGALSEIELAADGTVAEPLDVVGVDLRLSLNGRKLHELAAALGLPFPELPDFRSTSELTGGEGKWDLKALTVALGKSDLEGGIAVDTTANVPRLRAQLTSSRIDLADFKGLAGGTPAHASAPEKKAQEPSDRIFPDTPIRVQKLPGVDAELTFDGTRILSSTGVPFERVSLGLTLANGEIWVKPLRFHAAQGDVDLNLHFTPFTQDSPPKLGAEVDVRHVDLHRLLKGSGVPILRDTGGIVGGFAKIDSSGASMREFMARMSGDLGLFMENGQMSALLQELAPINVLGALGVYATGDRPLPIDCLVARFGIKEGIATATTLLLDTANTTVTGAGNLNFADETVTLSLFPRSKDPALVSLRTPVDVGGTFANRTYHVHLGGIAERLGAAVGLGILFPPAALLPLVDTGLGERNACRTAYAAQQPPGNPTPNAGSSVPKQR